MTQEASQQEDRGSVLITVVLVTQGRAFFTDKEAWIFLSEFPNYYDIVITEYCLLISTNIY